MKRTILGIHVANRVTTVQQLQQIYTNYGCNIKTRIGLHQVSDQMCSPAGLHILEMYGDDDQIREMERQLSSLDGVEVKKMVFNE